MQPFAELSAYGTTQAAIVGLTGALAAELGPARITVNAVAPGATVNAVAPGATVTQQAVRRDRGFPEEWAAVTPLGRAATVEDVAAPLIGSVSAERVSR